MASNKVTLRTAFSDTFRIGETVVTRDGFDFPSRSAADEAIEAARRSGVTLYEVPRETDKTEKKTTNEGSGS